MTTSSRPQCQHICIDFEGEKGSGDPPLPHLLGAWVPREGGGGDYRVYLLRDELEPMARAKRLFESPELRRTCSLEEALDELIAEAEARGALLVSYSQHEKEMVEVHMPQGSRTRERFLVCWYNIKDDTDPLLRERGVGWGGRSLEGALALLVPRFKLAEKPNPDVPTTCRKLSKAGRRSRFLRNWASCHVALADQLLRYNERDCVAVAELVGCATRMRPMSRLCTKAEPEFVG